MLLPAPARLSTTTCWPSSSDKRAAMMRAAEVGAAAGRERRDQPNGPVRVSLRLNVVSDCARCTSLFRRRAQSPNVWAKTFFSPALFRGLLRGLNTSGIDRPLRWVSPTSCAALASCHLLTASECVERERDLCINRPAIVRASSDRAASPPRATKVRQSHPPSRKMGFLGSYPGVGGRDVQGGLRTLYEAANVMLTRTTRFSSLKRWA